MARGRRKWDQTGDKELSLKCSNALGLLERPNLVLCGMCVRRVDALENLTPLTSHMGVLRSHSEE
jgi:hypothetical protein